MRQADNDTEPPIYRPKGRAIFAGLVAWAIFVLATYWSVRFLAWLLG